MRNVRLQCFMPTINVIYVTDKLNEMLYYAILWTFLMVYSLLNY